MTSCILYGLALARLQLAASGHNGGATRALGLAALSLLPLFGVIASVILITQLAHGTDSVLLILVQIGNLLAAVALFLVMGGYGISRSGKH